MPTIDLLLRPLGVDPQVFRPVYHAEKLMLGRRGRLARPRNRGLSPFTLLCVFAFVYGLAPVSLMMRQPPLSGGGLALTLCCFFLLMVVLSDHAEALVDPGQYRVLAAHPHDDRSVLFAKLAAVGRSLALLSAILFVPGGVLLTFMRGFRAALAFLGGAAGAALAVATLGLLIGVLLVRSGGRQAMERVLPWVQGGFQVGLFFA
ncbi:MAG: hypothetical protein M3O15_13120, partial [Acidobacteriota bacterium]|nr:hypothetical protein [Acidobacteriota bacterium]